MKEKLFLIQLDYKRVKQVWAIDSIHAMKKASDEYEGAKVTGIKCMD